MTDSKELFILYGSQTGNSEFIAKELHAKCVESQIPSVCRTLNEVKSLVLKELACAVVIICSTTGNADCPENADAWWRANKVRSLVSPSPELFD